MKIEYKSYVINCSIINQMHPYATGKTQQEAIENAMKYALSYGYKNAKVVGTNVEYVGGSSF